MSAPQLNLFEPQLTLPEGMRYETDMISADEEAELAAFVRTLALKPFEFAGGFLGNRRVQSFGSRYDYGTQRLTAAEAMPAQLLPLRERVAAFAGLAAERLQQALVTEYAPGAGIGWHKDKAMYGEVIGVSLLAPCRFRLRRAKTDGAWERITLEAAPRSAYLLSGPARTVWEHSIPPLEQLRYSITFRNLVSPP